MIEYHWKFYSLNKEISKYVVEYLNSVNKYDN